jgi:acyl-CoA synthetase (AMP-forming)/AMP-acid ligase II/lysophospholipase L1-like esterase/acyl carrier protein
MDSAKDELFCDRLRERGNHLAILTEGGAELTYKELADRVDRMASLELDSRSLVIVEATNNEECLIAYLACLRARAPVILVEAGSTAKDGRIAQTFSANKIFRLSNDGRWHFDEGVNKVSTLHADLCVMLSTSGTTGSPKLVRLSRKNIESNASAIAQYLAIVPSDRAITTLPPFYSFGMSVINSHLFAGATILLTEQPVSSEKFWRFFNSAGATTFSAVPFTFDILERVGFRSQTYPSLRYIAQAGGRLPRDRVAEYAAWADSARTQLFVMYGQTEAAPRMAYVPPDLLLNNPECVGVAVPGGSFRLLGEDGKPILDPDQPGELVYSGPNVMMGYAESAADLALPPSIDELHTGDLACRKPNGLYYIVGRKSRFSKILGLRISLDEIEQWLQHVGYDAIVSGDDKLIVVATTNSDIRDTVAHAVMERYGLPASALYVLEIDPIPTLSNGKIDYRALVRLANDAVSKKVQSRTSSVLDIYKEILDVSDVRSTDSFLDLGGDSVHFVEISLALEEYLSYLPENWEARSIESIEKLKANVSDATHSGVHANAVDPARKQPKANRRFLATAALVLSILATGEAALQLRSYLKTGRSAFALATGQTAIVTNSEWGLNTYRPNFSIINYAGPGGRFETNSLGFRSPEISEKRELGEIRIVVTGASTVAGAYATDNSRTFPSLLQQRIEQLMPDRVITVVNAGIEGYALDEIAQLIDRVIIKLQPQAVIIYPGFNDMANICRASQSHKHSLKGLPAPTLPNWILTRELISKNTVLLREPPVRALSTITDPESNFPTSYAQDLTLIATKLRNAGIEPVFVTVARGFKGVDEEQRKLAETALFYFPCLDIKGLIRAGELFNKSIIDTAKLNDVKLVDLATSMPGGSEFFVDAAHFTYKGENFAAEFIFQALTNDDALVQRMGFKTTKR